MPTNSGIYWVTWANSHAKNSERLDDLAEPFKSNAKAFIAALETAGAKVKVSATRRHENRAYLFHWAWLIGLGKEMPSAATAKVGIDIRWDHGDLKKSQAGAMEMVQGFGLDVPPKSQVAPALRSNHIAGKAVDMAITWTGKIAVAKKDGKKVDLTYLTEVNGNKKLHEVGASYGVKKHLTDAPHWSVDGH